MGMKQGWGGGEGGRGRGVIHHVSQLQADYNTPEQIQGNSKKSTPYPFGLELPPPFRMKQFHPRLRHSLQNPPGVLSMFGDC